MNEKKIIIKIKKKKKVNTKCITFALEIPMKDQEEFHIQNQELNQYQNHFHEKDQSEFLPMEQPCFVSLQMSKNNNFNFDLS